MGYKKCWVKGIITSLDLPCLRSWGSCGCLCCQADTAVPCLSIYHSPSTFPWSCSTDWRTSACNFVRNCSFPRGKTPKSSTLFPPPSHRLRYWTQPEQNPAVLLYQPPSKVWPIKITLWAQWSKPHCCSSDHNPGFKHLHTRMLLCERASKALPKIYSHSIIFLKTQNHLAIAFLQINSNFLPN